MICAIHGAEKFNNAITRFDEEFLVKHMSIGSPKHDEETRYIHILLLLSGKYRVL